MGWTHRDDETTHEGWVVAVLPDGTEGTRDTFDDLPFMDEGEVSWAWSVKYDGKHEHPRARGVRAVCLCGWASKTLRPTWEAPETAETELRELWYRHVEVSLSGMMPGRLRRLLAELDDMLGDMVFPPREGSEPDEFRPLAALHATSELRFLVDSLQNRGVASAIRERYTWDEVAGALGITRQSAHQKFRHVVAEDATPADPAS
ncbi:hypothetical protein [Streptomyces cinereoruber]|uniref:hypothetical protein n=1 Tax=Streptomyces cinereoruber TaxID=67260 RepID=UPI003C2DBD0C